MERSELQDILYAATCIVGGILLGGAFEFVLLKRLSKRVKKTRSKIDDLIISSFKGLLLFWCVLAGIFLGERVLDGPFSGTAKRILTALLVLSIALFLSRIINGNITRRAVTPSKGASIVTYIIRVIVFLIAGIIVLQSFGISVSPMLTALGVGGLAVALALQDTLSNLFSGIQVVASKQVRKGDYVRLSTGEEGYVTDISWKSTSIKMLSNNLIVVPNSKLSCNIFTNYTLPDKELAVLVEVRVSYSSDLEKVEQVTNRTASEIMASIQGGIRDFEPFIRYHTFSDSSVSFSVILRASEFVDQYLLKHEFIKALHLAYKKNNIVIPFPTRNIHLKKGAPEHDK